MISVHLGNQTTICQMKIKKHKMHKCSRCNKMATWLYMPGTNSIMFYCDDDVPRGCSCNVYNIKEDDLPDNKFLNHTIWWSKNDYEKCLKEKINPLIFASKQRNVDSFYFEILDENCRREPCCEYSYSQHGFEREHNFYVVSVCDVKKCLSDTIRYKLIGNLTMAKQISIYISKLIENEIGYNELMYNIKNICFPYINGDDDRSRRNISFYRSLRGRIYGKRKNFISDFD